MVHSNIQDLVEPILLHRPLSRSRIYGYVSQTKKRPTICGRYDKCLRTMINLYVAGALEKTSTFPHHIDPDLVAAVPTIPGPDGGMFHTENLRALQKKNLAPELQRAISTAISNAVVMKSSRKR